MSHGCLGAQAKTCSQRFAGTHHRIASRLSVITSYFLAGLLKRVASVPFGNTDNLSMRCGVWVFSLQRSASLGLLLPACPTGPALINRLNKCWLTRNPAHNSAATLTERRSERVSDRLSLYPMPDIPFRVAIRSPPDTPGRNPPGLLIYWNYSLS